MIKIRSRCSGHFQPHSIWFNVSNWTKNWLNRRCTQSLNRLRFLKESNNKTHRYDSLLPPHSVVITIFKNACPFRFEAVSSKSKVWALACFDQQTHSFAGLTLFYLLWIRFSKGFITWLFLLFSFRNINFCSGLVATRLKTYALLTKLTKHVYPRDFARLFTGLVQCWVKSGHHFPRDNFQPRKIPIK